MSEDIYISLGDVAHIIDPHPSHRAPEEVKEGIPFAGIGDISETGNLIHGRGRTVPKRILSEHSLRYQLSGNTIGFGRVATIGKVIDFQEGIRDLVLSPTMAVIEPHTIDRDYLLAVLGSQKVKKTIDKWLTGSTRSSLGIELLRDIPVPDLPRRKQEKIGRVYRTLSNAIAHTEALIEKYQQIKAGLMHDLFTRGIGADGKLRPPRDEAPELYQESAIGWIPKDWNWEIVADLCSQVVDCPHSTPIYRDSGIPCIRTADMEPGELILEQAYCVDEKDYKIRTQRLVPKEGDIIYSREGERLGIASPVGIKKVCLGQRVMLLRPDSNTDPSFLLWSMNHIDFYRRVVRGLGATTSPHVNVGDIKAIPISVPTYREQVLIGEKINAVQGVLNREKKFRAKLQQKKNGLMHDLLTGKVPVKVHSDEVDHISN
ncbi:restriction endonuclease subunit S [Coleofasciculus chthonoplastes]|uniref:restriction endonuclease subunit S n=1 Tax=Coleofasciculus chthonoplastes TaxID=64178 RepID=UPI0032F31549